MKPPALMAAAGVSVRTWHGWQQGADPKLSNVNLVRAEMARVRAALAARDVV